MKQQPRFLPGIKCHRCLDRALITPWRPPRGIDPGMRQYKCRSCKLVVYKVIGRSSPKAPAFAW
ncbi:hypothetical protein ES703_56493 [subsurface metagenome]